MTIYWRPHHEVYPELPPDQDFLAFNEATDRSIGRVYEMKHHVVAGSWRWSMYAYSTTGRVPFETSGYEMSRGDAGRRVVEAYKRLLEHNECHPRKSPARPWATGGALSLTRPIRNAAKLTVGPGR